MGEDARTYEEQHVHQVYNTIASHFSSTRFKPWPVVDDFLRNRVPGSIGLDVGCGNGKYLTVNRDVFIVASDRSSELIKFATHHHPHSAVVADVLDLPHPDASFDFAISIAVIHHLSSRERRRDAIRAVLRTLKPRSTRSRTSVDADGSTKEQDLHAGSNTERIDVSDAAHSDDRHDTTREGGQISKPSASLAQPTTTSTPGTAVTTATITKNTDNNNENNSGNQNHNDDGITTPTPSPSPTTTITTTTTTTNGGEALFFVWALEQKTSRRGWDAGDEQDVLVPWVLKPGPQSSSHSSSSSSSSSTHVIPPTPTPTTSESASATPTPTPTSASPNETETETETETKRTETGTETETETETESGKTKAKTKTKTYQRYYHLYARGELEQDVAAAGGQVVRAGYDRDNWWVVARRRRDGGKEESR